MPDRALSVMAQWGAALRAARKERRRIARWALAIGGLGGALGLTIASAPTPRLVWNASASAPVGLYAVGRRGKFARGEMVIARVPDPWRLFAARRHYIPFNVPLVKRVAAVPGDQVCAWGSTIFVNGSLVADRRAFDGRGRPLAGWSGCITLQNGAYLLLMERPDSFDGRYFGPSASSDIVGKAHLLWRR